MMKFSLKEKTKKIISEISSFILFFSLFGALILGYVKMYIVVILSIILHMSVTPKEKKIANDSRSRKERKRRIKERKNEPKKVMKNKLCKILFITYFLVSFTFLLLLRHDVLPSYFMKYFWVYVAGVMLSYFILLFGSVFYCPGVLGFSSNTKSKSSKDFSGVSDDVE